MQLRPPLSCPLSFFPLTFAFCCCVASFHSLLLAAVRIVFAHIGIQLLGVVGVVVVIATAIPMLTIAMIPVLALCYYYSNRYLQVHLYIYFCQLPPIDSQVFDNYFLVIFSLSSRYFSRHCSKSCALNYLVHDYQQQSTLARSRFPVVFPFFCSLFASLTFFSDGFFLSVALATASRLRGS